MSGLNPAINARLRPLYIAAFFHGLVLWYPIEKVFMRSIGFNDAGIGGMIAFYSTIMLLAETPSGVLADRWSRKGVLMLASVFLLLAALVGGLSTGPFIFLASTGFWGIFFALYSGTYESIVYDTVLEEGGKGDAYEKYYGRVGTLDSLALVLGSLVGGLAATYLGLRSPFFLTIPSCFMALLALWRFKEPQLHKAEASVSIRQHVVDTFGAVLKKRQLVPILAVLVAASSLDYLLFEFSQLWIIALAAPLVLFGPLNALQLATLGIGNSLGSKLHLQKRQRLWVFLAVIILCNLGLIYFRQLALVIISLDLLCVCTIALRLIFSRMLHDALSSKVRAGAASAVSTIGRIVIIPIALLFGYLSEHFSVFQASWTLFALTLVAVVFTFKTYSSSKKLTAAKITNQPIFETYQK